MANRGQFITIEGVEGVGKSTNLAYVESLLKTAGIEYLTTREPGGTDIAEKIREVLLDKNNIGMKNKTELMLVFAARAQHVESLIEPALASGRWVICDRFTDSSYAYQGSGRGIAIDDIRALEEYAIDDFQPDMTLLLDLPVEVGLARAGQRGELDRFESESEKFFIKVRDGFLSRAKQYPGRFKIIDASRKLEDVQVSIQSSVQPLIDSWSAA